MTPRFLDTGLLPSLPAPPLPADPVSPPNSAPAPSGAAQQCLAGAATKAAVGVNPLPGALYPVLHRCVTDTEPIFCCYFCWRSTVTVGPNRVRGLERGIWENWGFESMDQNVGLVAVQGRG